MYLLCSIAASTKLICRFVNELESYEEDIRVSLVLLAKSAAFTCCKLFLQGKRLAFIRPHQARSAFLH